MIKQIVPSVVIASLVLGLSFITFRFFPFTDMFGSELGITDIYFSLTLLFVVGFLVYHYSPKTPIPIFVWAILFGMALQLPLLPVVADRGVLLFMVEFIMAFVLFAGGISVPVKNFKKYFAPIATLSIAGTVISVLLFAVGLMFITNLYGLEVSVLALLLLGAILSSIDPATVLPTLERLHFRRPFIRDIAVSESAVNDVVGVVLTRFFLIAALGTTGALSLSMFEGFIPLFSKGAFASFATEIAWGVGVGLLGAWILKTWSLTVGKKHWSDPLLFFSVPLFCFALGSLFGGAGFLSAFIAGLLYEAKEHTVEIHAFFDSLVDRFMKPVIFVLLGALAPMNALLEYVAIGTLAAIFFMFVVRPLVVLTSLLPWMIQKKSLLTWQELLFLSFIRETGAVPAILVLYVVATGVMGAQFIFSIALWVILYTLIIEPPLTPLLARKLEIER